MLRILIAAVLLLAAPPAYADNCQRVRDAVETMGQQAVIDAAIGLGYTRAEINSFRRHCARQRSARARQVRR